MKKGIILSVIGIIIIGITYCGFKIFNSSNVKENKTKNDNQKIVNSINNKSKSEPELNEDECVFDLNTQTDDFLKQIPEFLNYTWDKEEKKATIKLENGNTLLVTRGGCTHFYFYGKLILNDSELNLSDENKLFEKALWIAEKLFDKSDYELIKTSLENKNYDIEKSENHYYLTFKQDDYCEMTLIVDKLIDKGLITIEIGFYLC